MPTEGPQSDAPSGTLLDPLKEYPPTWAYLDANDVLRQVAEPAGGRSRRLAVRPVLRITDRFLVGTLDLRVAELPYLLEFVRCRFQEAPDLRQAKLPGVEFNSCWLPGLKARNLSCAGDMVLAGTVADGTIDLADADIGGYLVLTGGRLNGKPALIADRVRVSGHVEAAGGFHSTGLVRMVNARLGGWLRLVGAKIEVSRGERSFGSALRLDGTEIGEGIDAREALIAGQLGLVNVVVRGSVLLDGALISDDVDTAIEGRGLSVGGDLDARGVAVVGPVRLPDARIGGNLHLDGARLSSPGVGRRPSLDLEATQIGGSLICAAQFSARNEIRLRHAEIGRVTHFRDAKLGAGFNETALDASGLRTHDLRLEVDANRGRVDLRHARCMSLADNEQFWDGTGHIELDDFRYDALAVPIDADDKARVRQRLRWMRNGMRDRYQPGPYDQLAAVLRDGGTERHASTVLMVKQRRRYDALAEGLRAIGPLIRLWSLIQRGLVGYGYRPARAVATLIVLLAAAAAVFRFTDAGRSWALVAILAVGAVFLATVATGITHRAVDFTALTTQRGPAATILARPELTPRADHAELDEAQWEPPVPAHPDFPEQISVAAYVDTENPLVAREVFSALDDLIELLGYERPVQETLQRGSWWRRTTAKLKRWADSEDMRARRVKVERALELVTIDVRQAEVDVKSAEAVARLMASLQDVSQACLRAGSVLVVKYQGDSGPVVLSRNLSQLEIMALERFPEIQAKPRLVLESLATAISAMMDYALDDDPDQAATT